jgi:hypothetical protein
LGGDAHLAPDVERVHQERQEAAPRHVVAVLKQRFRVAYRVLKVDG